MCKVQDKNGIVSMSDSTAFTCTIGTSNRDLSHVTHNTTSLCNKRLCLEFAIKDQHYETVAFTYSTTSRHIIYSDKLQKITIQCYCYICDICIGCVLRERNDHQGI